MIGRHKRRRLYPDSQQRRCISETRERDRLTVNIDFDGGQKRPNIGHDRKTSINLPVVVCRQPQSVRPSFDPVLQQAKALLADHRRGLDARELIAHVQVTGPDVDVRWGVAADADAAQADRNSLDDGQLAGQ